MLDACGEKCVVIGNVPTGLFIDGSREEMEDEVNRCLDIGKDRGGYILCTGCEISSRGDIERVRWFCELASALGKHEKQ